MSEIPPYIKVGDVGRACSRSTIWARRYMQRVGIAEKHGSEWVVGESRLQARLPEIYQRVFEYFALRDEIDQDRSSAIETDHAESGS